MYLFFERAFFQQCLLWKIFFFFCICVVSFTSLRAFMPFYLFWPLFYLFILLECNCFTLLLVSAVQQWISYMYTHIPFLLSIYPPLLPPPGRHRAPGLAPCVVRQLPTSCLFYTWQHTSVNATLSIPSTLPSSSVSTSLFSMSVSPFLT